MRGSLVAPDFRSSVRTNLFTNPDTEGGTSCLRYYVADGIATLTQRMDGGYSSNSYVRMEYTSAPTTSVSGIYASSSAPSSRIPVVAGESYAALAFIRTNITRNFYVCIEWYDALTNGNVVARSTGPNYYISEPNVWVPIVHAATAPTGTVGAVMTFYSNGPSPMTAGSWQDIDGIVLEKAPNGLPYRPSYFSGNSPNARWTGAPHASQSIEQTSIHSKNLISDSAFAFLHKPELLNQYVQNVGTYWGCPWRTVNDGTKGKCVEFVTNDDTKPQGLIFFPQVADSSNFSLRPIAHEGEKYTVSADVLADNNLPFTLGFRRVNKALTVSNDGQGSATTITKGTGSWQRYSYTATLLPADEGYYLGAQLRLSQSPIPPIGTTVRIANVQVEKSPVATAFEATRPDW